MQRIFLNVGYELSEKQLRAHFITFGVLSDLYLPKHTNGRNKGYGFATFATEHSLALALHQPKHIINGVTVQVKRAGPRPPDVSTGDSKPALHPVTVHVQPFGRGPRVYVGGVPNCVTEERVREHFRHWGSVSDVYFPGARGQKRLTYCFVTFDNLQSAERACIESDRSLDGWPLESISMAEDRRDNKHHINPITTGSPSKQPLASQPVACPESWKLPGYVTWLQLQYQQQLETAIANMAGGAMSSLPYSQVSTQRFPQYPSSSAAPIELENAYLQANLNSSSANQQRMDSRAPQVVPPTSPGNRSGQNMQYSAEAPDMAAYDAPSSDMDYWMMVAQHSMVNAAGGGQGRQTTVDHVGGQDQFGGEQQCASVMPDMVMPFPLNQ
ncbi:TPA: hypothetical protein ACH3X1_000079 [Trebouxia sp. C0004]